jgi:beta-glucosidase
MSISLAKRVSVAIGLVGLCLAIGALGGSLTGPASARPSADCPWLDATKTPNTRAKELVSAMTLDDKLAIVQGDEFLTHYGFAGYLRANPALCIPELVLSDGPAGVAGGQTQVTAFPAPMAVASTWNPAIQERVGYAIGRETFLKGGNVLLAPALNMARVPMNGRNFEYYGEDPFLAGKTTAAVVHGVQQNPVVATLKHYAVNNQETDRGTVSAEVDERTLREIYLPAFEAGIKEGGAGAVMCAYNRVNGTYACENPQLLRDILKHDWKFDGWVMTDWGASHSTVASALAGLDQEQPGAAFGGFLGNFYGPALREAVLAGDVPMSRLDDMALRIVRSMFRLGLFDNPLPPQPDAFALNASTPEHRDISREAAEEGIVLLKNEGSLLPLDRIGVGTRIAVIGRPASPEGAKLTHVGGGSAYVHATPVSPLEAITQRAATRGAVVTYTDGAAVQDAVAAATAADIAVVFARDFEQEGTDRQSLALNDGGCVYAFCASFPQNQDEYITAVAQANPNTVVVLHTGGPVLMPWLGQVKSVVEAWYTGSEMGNAVSAVLFGDVNPSGKLAQTFPRAEADLPTRTPQQYPGAGGKAVYSEGLQIGYRWYDAQGIEPLFPFGHGLSYTTFAYSKLTASATAQGAIRLRFTVANTGARPGAEVAQVYVGSPAASGEPPQQLKAYRKVYVGNGQKTGIALKIEPRTLARWDSEQDLWRVDPGTYRILVGSSSRDIRLQATMTLPARTFQP